MTPQPAPFTDNPQHLLAATRELTRRVRLEQRGAWFPLLLFAAVTFAAIPFYGYGPTTRHCGSVHVTGTICTVYPTLVLWYWPISLLLAYVAISWFYLHRARQRGVGTRARPFVVLGVLLVVLANVWLSWFLTHPGFLSGTLHLQPSQATASLRRVVSPAGVIGLALLLLAWIERSWPLLVVTTVYLIAVAIPVYIGSVSRPSPWAFLPHTLLGGTVLLLGGVVLAYTQRARGRTTA